MHLLQAKAGAVSDGSEAVDLGQTPGDIVVLTAADSELASLSAAAALLDEPRPKIRLANIMHLGHPMSVDLYAEEIVAEAKLVVIRLLGGTGYWNYGCEQVAATCHWASDRHTRTSLLQDSLCQSSEHSFMGMGQRPPTLFSDATAPMSGIHKGGHR